MFPFFLALHNGSQVSIVALWATCCIEQVIVDFFYVRIYSIFRILLFISMSLNSTISRHLEIIVFVFLIFLFVPGVFCCQHFSGPSRVSDYFGSTT